MTRAAFTLWQRELVRFFRQPSRVIGAIGSPAIFWLLLGSGFGESFRPSASPVVNGYLEYFYPGTLALIDTNPFPDRPPKFVRAVYYEYRFTTPEERRQTGAWWHRDFVGLYYPPVTVGTRLQ